MSLQGYGLRTPDRGYFRLSEATRWDHLGFFQTPIRGNNQSDHVMNTTYSGYDSFWGTTVHNLLYSHIQLHNTYTYIRGNIVNNNDDFNERTNTLLYKNISLTLYSRKG